MKGRNPRRKVVREPGETLWVQEVFATVQGEGPFSGRRSVFVRLGGCTLACFWCDTDFESSAWKPSVEDLVAVVLRGMPWEGDRLVVLTGGEPLRQPVRKLIDLLLSAGCAVQVETSGTAWAEDLPTDPRVSIVVSPKTPTVHREVARRAIAWKYIGRAGELCPDDGLPMMSTQEAGRRARLARPPAGVPVYLGPCDEQDADANARNAEAVFGACLRHGHLAYVQAHKILGAP